MHQFLSFATELLILAFLIITFLQSGIDKLLDWKGNVTWLKGHFSESPFKNIVPQLLVVLVILEMITALLCFAGIYQIFTSSKTEFAFYAAILSSITLLCLLFGQRMAKDYEGAKTIVIYFIPIVLLVYLLQ
ncbi:DoxX family protein [Cellulophaga baltica]|uniref:DoxX family protein n=1 Tax=Cellulophaga TaxID=104264 RepID=UPI001C069E52|nr:MULTISPECIES: DoxX family protein [Cellulophaga]MBU2995912.1 DoxX family protein [Cellulophaga baltica]MDO6767307.1 DoxX family protein [Cellulophaga sp. 1_MG-2023]